MNIIIYEWKTYNNLQLQKNLCRLGHTVIMYQDESIIESRNSEGLRRELEKGYDLIFSYNYFIAVANECKEAGIPYIAWIQDAPQISLYDESALLDTNYFFCFDSEQYRELKQRGGKNVWYLPLAVDTEEVIKTVEQSTTDFDKKYTSDVSFVGSLYSEHNMYCELDGISKFVKGYLDGIVATQLQIPLLRFTKRADEYVVTELLNREVQFSGREHSSITDEILIENLLDRQVTMLERQAIISSLAEQVDLKLYTGSDTRKWPHINNMGQVDYASEMPIVFKNTKINLNISLRSIRAGIPLRVLDIMASGGFLISNAQKDLELFFEEGKNIVTYRTRQELFDKIDYYLQHEEERRRIAEAGRQIVKEQFDFQVLLPQILQRVKNHE